MPSTFPIRRIIVAVVLSCAVLVSTTACGGETRTATGTAQNAARNADLTAAESGASPSASAERQKLAKTRFVANAGLAAGAAYQWIVKPFKAGKFKKGAKGRTFALVKAGLAGAFTYNRLKAATENAKGDPLLSKALAPLSSGIDSLKDLGSKLRKGDASDADVGQFEKVIGGVKDAGAGAGAPVKDQVPSAGQLSKG
uniref:Secreted protein n=1 Tax=Streptomyces sp. NBC_00003 TaxID=2903608 RepID=A0AAU2VAJ0_9ACTN